MNDAAKDTQVIEAIMDVEDVFLKTLCQVHAKNPDEALALLRRYGQYRITKALKAVVAAVAG
jgi:hypothetical protein